MTADTTVESRITKAALPGQPDGRSSEPQAAKPRSSAEQQVTEGGLVSSAMTVMQDKVKVDFRRGRTFARQ
jgi:hypothetical protein